MKYSTAKSIINENNVLFFRGEGGGGCMRKMKVQVEPGYSVPVVGRFTRTMSF